MFDFRFYVRPSRVVPKSSYSNPRIHIVLQEQTFETIVSIYDTSVVWVIEFFSVVVIAHWSDQNIIFFIFLCLHQRRHYEHILSVVHNFE